MVALTKLLFAVRFSYGAWVTISDLRGLKFQAQSFLFVLLLSGLPHVAVQHAQLLEATKEYPW